MRELDNILMARSAGFTYSDLEKDETKIIDYTWLPLENLRIIYLSEPRHFFTSPKLRKHFVREDEAVHPKGNILGELVLRKVYMLFP
jgi:hypothetical protein